MCLAFTCSLENDTKLMALEILQPHFFKTTQDSTFPLWYHLRGNFLKSIMDLPIKFLTQKIFLPRNRHLTECILKKGPCSLIFLLIDHILEGFGTNLHRRSKVFEGLQTANF